MIHSLFNALIFNIFNNYLDFISSLFHLLLANVILQLRLNLWPLILDFIELYNYLISNYNNSFKILKFVSFRIKKENGFNFFSKI